MSLYSDYRHLYTTESEFLSGSVPYTGYIRISGDVAYTTDNVPLTSNNTYLTDVHTSEFFRDRLIDDVLILPFQLKDIAINVNDIITSELINDRFEKLHTNTTYVFSKLQAPVSILPATDSVRYIALNSSTTPLQWFSSQNDTVEYDDTDDFKFLENIVDATGMTAFNNEDRYTMFMVSSSNFISLSANFAEVGIVENSTNVVQSDDDLTFIDIRSIDVSDDGILVVADYGRSAVYKYDITSYATVDDTFYNKRIYMGAHGGVRSVSNIAVHPLKVAIKSDEIAVLYSDNTVRIYDTDFNYITTLSVANFRKDTVVAMKYNIFFDELWIITHNKGVLQLVTVDDEYRLIKSTQLAEPLEASNSVKGIAFSKNDSNYWYLATKSFVYKRLVNAPARSIGILNGFRLFTLYDYKWNNAFFPYDTANILWNSGSNRSSEFGGFTNISIDSSSSNYDKVFLFKYGRFYVYNEPNPYVRVLSFDNDDNYNLDDISISSREFIQPSVYNKEVYKLINNIITIKNNIVGNFFGTYNIDGVFELVNYNYNIDFSKFEINTRDIIVHSNEAVNYYTINRTIRNLFNLQQAVIDAVAFGNDALIPQPRTNNILVLS